VRVPKTKPEQALGRIRSHGLFGIDIIEAGIDESPYAFSEKGALAGKMAVEDRRGDSELMDDRGYVCVSVSLFSEFLGGQRQNALVHPLVLLCSQVYGRLVRLAHFVL
jgi:hypothetical protein